MNARKLRKATAILRAAREPSDSGWDLKLLNTFIESIDFLAERLEAQAGTPIPPATSKPNH